MHAQIFASLIHQIAAQMKPATAFRLGITGAVSVGKSTLAGQIVAALEASRPSCRIETHSSDGFLFPNAILEGRSLIDRKGFPETYDLEAMRAALEQVRCGTASFPVHSHVTYDIDPAMARQITRPDVLILEGLSLAPMRKPDQPPPALDCLVYLDADLDLITQWYVERFLGFWEAAATDPTSFYVRFRHLDRDGAAAMAQFVWDQINLPNFQQHVRPARDLADIVLTKGDGHRLIGLE